MENRKAVMKRQTKTLSVLESVSNAIIGLIMSFATQLLVFPWFGIHVSPKVNLQITIIFFIMSFARSYFLRRLFNAIKF